ncbi:hypothetical protein NDU88_005515 [Pleurodeles waltl]|uniref:Uncharacterized protein n=1 Tax=Pleurodeles waltl TaxID=8319 RepID=A0AAV7QL75_PLEWA|nr:hypothetical protein NDU88_005515 [Pleurodeles waltl]
MRPLKLRIQEHFRNILKLETKAPLAEHYKTFHHNERSFKFSGIHRITPSPRGAVVSISFNMAATILLHVARCVPPLSRCFRNREGTPSYENRVAARRRLSDLSQDAPVTLRQNFFCSPSR